MLLSILYVECFTLDAFLLFLPSNLLHELKQRGSCKIVFCSLIEQIAGDGFKKGMVKNNPDVCP